MLCSVMCNVLALIITCISLLKTLENIKAVLETAGCTCNNGKNVKHLLLICQYYVAGILIVVKTTVLLADIKDYGTVNSVYTNCKF